MRANSYFIWMVASAIVGALFGSNPAAFQHGEIKLTNPVKPTPESVAAGQKLFEKTCAPCHGAGGKGDGKMAAQLDPKPSDLTDSEWKHGEKDGDIFTVIRDGSKGTGMKGFAGRMTSQDIWNVVNYLRTLGPGSVKPLQ